MVDTNLPLRVFAQALQVEPFLLMAQIKFGKNVIRAENVDAFKANTGVSIDSLFNEKIDCQLLRRRLLGENKTLPEKYNYAKGSKIRSTANIVEYLRFVKGWDWVHEKLSELQLHEGLFEFPDSEINFHFFLDLFKEMERLNVSDQMIRLMAYHSVAKNEQTPLGQTFKRAHDFATVYRIFESNIALYDVNFTYRFEIDRDHARLFITPKHSVMEALKIKAPGNRKVCIYKQALFGSFSMYIQAYPLIVREHKCMYLGDRHCEYSVDLTQPRQTRRLFAIRSEVELPQNGQPHLVSQKERRTF